MPNYQNGKIYAIKSNETEDVYIGSTCETLNTRLIKHKSAYKTGKRCGTIVQILKYSDAYIELIEAFPCETKRELLNKEGETIRNTSNCVNTQIQGRTKKQWDEDNKEHCKEYRKKFRTENKDVLDKRYNDWYNSDKGKAYLEKRKAKINVKVVCSKCEKEVSKSNLGRHQKSKTCKNIT